MSNTSYQRRSLSARRKALSPAFVAKASNIIVEKIVASSEFLNSQHIAYYISHDNEVDLSPIIDKANSLKKSLCLPIFSEPHFLKFYQVDKNTQYQKNKFGILEPISDKLISIDQLALMLIPLVAFDKNCHRIGRGLGCYDRYLQNKHHCQLMGVAYEFQKIPEIQPEKWDIVMDCVVTESAMYSGNKSRRMS